MNESTQVTYGAGTITVHMNSTSATEVTAPIIRFGNYNEALTSCFSRKELEVIDGGAEAEVEINFHMLDDLEDGTEKEQFQVAVQKAEKTYGTLHEGIYIETTASKSLDGYEYTDIDYLTEDTELQIDVPLYLVAQGREYYVITNDMGVCELEEDVDADADTLSVNIHNMSTLFVVYQDENEALKSNQNIFRIKAQYLFLGAILALLVIWRVVEHFHKKDKS